MKFIFIVAGVVILSGCSSPATPEDIKEAIQECPEARSLIDFSLRECFGITCREPSPLTKRKLQGFVKDCQEEREIKADPSSSENMVKAQRAALAANDVEIVPPDSVELNASDEDAAP